jgi:protein-disulfide isomerase
MAEKKSLFELMEPKQAFLFGIIGGVLVLCTIGFFILLLGGVDMSKKSSGRGTTGTTPTVQQPTAQAPTAGTVSIPPVTNDDHVRGSKNPKVTIVEYSDLECPFCGRFHDTMKEIINVYGDDVAWVYRHFPLESIHPNARLAANAVECAADQGNYFWPLTDLLFENLSQGLSQANILAAARTVGVNTTRLETCMTAGTYNELVTQQSRDAQAAGGRGTPFSVAIGPNGEQIEISGAQPFASVEATILQLLN